MKALATAGLGALVLACSAAAAPPIGGVVVPGVGIGGITLGAGRPAVLGRWGSSYGICRGCPAPTWYFNYAPFQPQGTSVTFQGGRVVALETVWAPPGWHTTKGLRIGDAAGLVTSTYGALDRRNCDGYYVLVLPGKDGAVTEFTIHDDTVWGLGVSVAPAACR